MQLVEQLHHRKSDAQKLLLSRKRKLAELYWVTACTGYKPNSQVNDLYFQQLQAFQDANDLQKGRLFDESTLPIRRDIVRQPTSNATSNTKTDALLIPKDVRRSVSPSKGASQPSNRGSVQPLSRTATPQPQVTTRPSSTQPTAEGIESGNLKRTSNTDVDRDSTPLPISTTPADVQVKNEQASQKVVRQHDVDQAQDRSRKASPTFPPPTESQEVQSSPTSTDRASYSHTPAPDAGSPTTSPEDDVPPVKDIIKAKPPEPQNDEPQTPDTNIPIPNHKISISSIDVDMIDGDPSIAFDSPIQASKHPPPSLSKDSKPKKPSISVNTQQPPQKSYFDSRQNSIVETPAAISSQSPSRQTPITTPAVDSARRATRIQSGALQKKSVSEILGETPRSTSPNNESSTSALARAAEKERKDKERSKLSTVVFAKPQRPINDPDIVEIVRSDQPSDELTKNEKKDYMYTLFESKAHSQNRQSSLPYLLQHSHKTISTTDHLVDYHYQAHCRVLKRLYQLQNLDRWSLRQRKRAEEPARPTSHWDFVVDHVKWMRTDFREERRWKIAAARATAESCAEWVAASAEDRKALQIRVRTPRHLAVQSSEETEIIDNAASSPPDLVSHGEEDSVSEDIADPREVICSVAPAAIFSLGAAEFAFATERTPAFDKLLNELPLYQPSRIEPDLSKSNLAEQLDARWKTDIVPVSKYATEKLKVKEFKPPLKRSRYEYNLDDSPPSKRPALKPRETDVALFKLENKAIRDRIHPGHSFRPPAEHPMPSQAFFETRTSSQWLAADDDEVRKQAREYSFNWLLISDLMAPPTLYVSGQDRRSAWECFERWIGLEGMPADMSKTPYFKTYSNRIETAQRNVQAQWEEHERRNGTTPVPTRKKTTLPVRVERKHNRRHLFMLDAMRKLAKKREAVRQKAIHSADMAAMRKSNDVHAPRPGMKTPAEWSQLKYEREQKMAKQQEMYKQQLIAHQRAVVQQQRGQNPNTNGVPVPPHGANQLRMPGPNGVPIPGMPSGHLQVPNGQPRPHPSMMGMPQGIGVPAGMVGPKGIPQAQMAAMARSMAGSPEQVKLQQQQLIRQAQQAQQAQQNGTHSSPNVQQATMANGSNSAAAYLNAISQSNGQGSPPNAANNASPRPGSSHMGNTLSSGNMPKINQLYSSIKERNPNMSDEDVRNIATQQLLQWQQQATAAAAGNIGRQKAVNQAALNAAMGAANSGANAAAFAQNAMNQSVGTGGQGMMSYEQAQQYHQRIRMQQAAAQQNVANAARGIPAPLTHGMTNSPVMNMVRPVSQHSQQGVNRSVTPREARSGSVSNMSNSNGNAAQGNGSGNSAQQNQTNVQGQGSPRNAPVPMQTQT